jgi:hypothetical protein
MLLVFFDLMLLVSLDLRLLVFFDLRLLVSLDLGLLVSWLVFWLVIVVNYLLAMDIILDVMTLVLLLSFGYIFLSTIHIVCRLYFSSI